MLFNWDVNRNSEVVLGTGFGAFATGICVLAVQNMAPAELEDRLDSVCLSVCVLSVCSTFCRPLFGPGRARIQL